MSHPSVELQVPTPLGFCIECIREGTFLRALTLWQGSSLCAHHAVHLAKPDPKTKRPTPREGQTAEEQLLDQLRKEAEHLGTHVGF